MAEFLSRHPQFTGECLSLGIVRRDVSSIRGWTSRRASSSKTLVNDHSRRTRANDSLMAMRVSQVEKSADPLNCRQVREGVHVRL